MTPDFWPISITLLFFSDYLRFGACPGYGKTIEMMEESIRLYPKHIIWCDNKPVGCISCHQIRPQESEIGCLCVIPEYQGKGIGTQAARFAQKYYLCTGRLSKKRRCQGSAFFSFWLLWYDMERWRQAIRVTR